MAKQYVENSGKRRSPQETGLVDKLLSGTAKEKYQGKQVVLIGGQIFILPQDDRRATVLVFVFVNPKQGHLFTEKSGPPLVLWTRS
jgi:hypothetical protein